MGDAENVGMVITIPRNAYEAFPTNNQKIILIGGIARE